LCGATRTIIKGDSYLDEEGIREEVEAVAIKQVLAWQLE
jgi:hypothetical protein